MTQFEEIMNLNLGSDYCREIIHRFKDYKDVCVKKDGRMYAIFKRKHRNAHNMTISICWEYSQDTNLEDWYKMDLSFEAPPFRKVLTW